MKYHVVSICNALVDVIYDSTDSEIQKLGLTKGRMHLLEQNAQKELHNNFKTIKGQELGGSALNAMRALNLLGQKIFFAGMIAEDKLGNEIKSRLQQLNIDHDLHLCTSEGTGSCVILVSPDGERTMATYLGASRMYSQNHIPTTPLQNSQIFHFCAYQWDTEQQKIAINNAINTAKKAGALISFDLSDPWVVENHRQDFIEIINKNKIDLIFANQEEAQLLYGFKTPEETAAKLAAQGIQVAIKLGAEGALLQEKQQIDKIPAQPTNVVDTTAAGDMFAAGFLYGKTLSLKPKQCGEIATTLAADVISRYGASLSNESIAEAKRLAQNLS